MTQQVFFIELFRIVKERRLVRLKIQTLDGEVDMKLTYEPRFDQVFSQLKGKAKRRMPVFILDKHGVISPAPNRVYRKFFTYGERAGAYEHMKAIESDPPKYFAEYGKRTGVCGVCNRVLTNDDKPHPADGLTSVDRGIGPVCAEALGMFGPPPKRFDMGDLLDSLAIEEEEQSND